ncbi:MAG: sulfatase-like hydrolase/transferase, partial [Planctomycetaceae bacterium]
PRAAYAAMISRLDRNVGNLLSLLDELHLADNTIVIFSSDNGTTMLQAEVDYEFFQSVGELRGLKGSLYEGGVRVPAIVRWPGHVAAGSTSDIVSGFEDWLPTVLDLISDRPATPGDVDGISLAPTLLGQQQPERPFLYREFPAYGGQQSIRVGGWKAMRQNLSQGRLDVELYNLAVDVGEQHNVAAEHPEIVARLSRLMTQEHLPSVLFPLPGIDPAAEGSKSVR